MNSLNKKQKVIIVFISIIIISVFCYYIYLKEEGIEVISDEQIEKEIMNEKTEDSKEEKVIIVVHIAGAVNKEGIIELTEGQRVSDAIEKAGGLKENADLSEINLAYVLQDGEKVYIPIAGENSNNLVQSQKTDLNKSSSDANKKININTASQTELETLTGIGPSTALKIIEYRKEKGRFKSIDELKDISGIGEKKFEKIKNNIIV